MLFTVSLHSESMHLLSRSIILLEFKKFFIKPTLSLPKSIFFTNSENKIESLHADSKTYVFTLATMSIRALMNCPGPVYLVGLFYPDFF